MDTPTDVGGWETVVRGLSDKASLNTLKSVGVKSGVALALKGIYDGGDVGVGIGSNDKVCYISRGYRAVDCRG